jgi:hypothetical protein
VDANGRMALIVRLHQLSESLRWNCNTGLEEEKSVPPVVMSDHTLKRVTNVDDLAAPAARDNMAKLLLVIDRFDVDKAQSPSHKADCPARGTCDLLSFRSCWAR